MSIARKNKLHRDKKGFIIIIGWGKSISNYNNFFFLKKAKYLFRFTFQYKLCIETFCGRGIDYKKGPSSIFQSAVKEKRFYNFLQKKNISRKNYNDLQN